MVVVHAPLGCVCFLGWVECMLPWLIYYWSWEGWRWGRGNKKGLQALGGMYDIYMVITRSNPKAQKIYLRARAGLGSPECLVVPIMSSLHRPNIESVYSVYIKSMVNSDWIRSPMLSVISH